MVLASRGPAGCKRGERRALAVVRVALIGVAGALAILPALAMAGQASSGQLLFYPCTNCHPVTMVPGSTPGSEKPSRPLPNGFTGHGIKLQGHTALGKDVDTQCLTCHDDPSRNPGMLKAADGSLIPITNADLSKDPQIALVCYRCHEAKYREWKAGTHGKHKPSCVAAGCHDPHTPQYIYASPLAPINGVGWQFQVLPTRAPFLALPRPAPAPATETPGWLQVAALLGVVVAAGFAGALVMGAKR